MVKRSSLILLLLGFAISVFSQDYPYAFRVDFTDKDNSAFTIDQPSAFLSEQAIQRREKAAIEISINDLPVNQSYIDSVVVLGGVFHVKSNWFNSAVFYTTDSLQFIQSVKPCSFVKDIVLVYRDKYMKNTLRSKWINSSDSSVYGSSYNQIEMCNGQIMHAAGYQGQGMNIAVIDAGFYHADQYAAFDSLFINNQIIDTWDFIDGNSEVYDDYQHGMSVLSIMGGNISGQLVGTAPKANYYLYRSEDTFSEYPIEEENWIAAAERADSIGVDIITTSLGYSIFTDSSFNHTYADMDGKSTRITQGAEAAFSKGIIVLSSAGNEGSNSWYYITAPSDGKHVLCIGAVDQSEILAGFSSHGPSYDGRTKPDVVAKGSGTTIVTKTGVVATGNGTSYSCPVMAGLVACAWQALPDYSNTQLFNLLHRLGDRVENPDNDYGWGLPDFSKILFLVDSINYESNVHDQLVKVYPNPVNSELNLNLYVNNETPIQIYLVNTAGSVISLQSTTLTSGSYNKITLSNLGCYPTGGYILRVVTASSVFNKKIIIQ